MKGLGYRTVALNAGRSLSARMAFREHAKEDLAVRMERSRVKNEVHE